MAHGCRTRRPGLGAGRLREQGAAAAAVHATSAGSMAHAGRCLCQRARARTSVVAKLWRSSPERAGGHRAGTQRRPAHRPFARGAVPRAAGRRQIGPAARRQLRCHTDAYAPAVIQRRAICDQRLPVRVPGQLRDRCVGPAGRADQRCQGELSGRAGQRRRGRAVDCRHRRIRLSEPARPGRPAGIDRSHAEAARRIAQPGAAPV